VKIALRKISKTLANNYTHIAIEISNLIENRK